MPNHISQALIIDSNNFEEIKAVVKGYDSDGNDISFDHSAFFPMPAELKGTVSGTREVIPDKEYEEVLAGRTREELLQNDEMGCGIPISQSMDRDYMSRFGASNWYKWARQNWGTKWGVYASEPWKPVNFDSITPLVLPAPKGVLPDSKTLQCVRFESAWSPATKIIYKLSKKFPEAKFLLCAIDEGYFFAGVEGIVNGKTVFESSIDCDNNSPIFRGLADLVGFTLYEDESDESIQPVVDGQS